LAPRWFWGGIFWAFSVFLWENFGVLLSKHNIIKYVVIFKSTIIITYNIMFK
jgi:hypothetical protein